MSRAGRLLPLVLLLGACAHPLAPSSVATIDVLDFIVGDPALWPRFGDQHQHQVLGTNRITWTKYTLGWSFESWRWDADWIYHEVDHAIDGNRRWEHYTFSDGRWLPRRLPVSGWSLDLPENRMTWVDAQCQPQPERPAPYHVRAWLVPHVDAGGDLGTRDTLILEYAPNPQQAAAGTVEQFHFAKGAGWFLWTRADGVRIAFNRLGGVARLPTTWCNEGQDAGRP